MTGMGPPSDAAGKSLAPVAELKPNFVEFGNTFWTGSNPKPNQVGVKRLKV